MRVKILPPFTVYVTNVPCLNESETKLKLKWPNSHLKKTHVPPPPPPMAHIYDITAFSFQHDIERGQFYANGINWILHLVSLWKCRNRILFGKSHCIKVHKFQNLRFDIELLSEFKYPFCPNLRI